MSAKMKNILNAALWGMIASSVGAQTLPAPNVNHNVVGWMMNREYGTYEPDSFAYSQGSTIPTSTPATPPYDSALLTPSKLVLHNLTRGPIAPSSSANKYTLLNVTNVPAMEKADTYVEYPFVTADLANTDILINQARYAINSNSHGTAHQIQMSLVDNVTKTEYKLASPMRAIDALNRYNDRGYFFVDNQNIWPMGENAGDVQANTHDANTVAQPIPLVKNRSYSLRAYLSQAPGAKNALGVIDDVMIFMKTITVDAQDDGLQPGGTPAPEFSFTAQDGGTTPTVITNDRFNTSAVPANNFTLTQINADQGLVLNTNSGAIAVDPGQPGQKKLTYSICPKYDQSVIPNFQSGACKSAVATVTLTGPAAPPTVSVTCTPATIPDSVSPPAVCTIKADTVVTNPLTVYLTPTNDSRYQTDCGTTIQIAGGSDHASCNITAVPNDTPGDGDATATIALVADPAYVIGTGNASVTVQDDDLSIVGSVQGAPAAFLPSLEGQPVNYSLTCAPGTAAPVSGQLTIGANGQLSAPATHVDPGTVCTGMTLDNIAQLPAAPAGYTWASADATTDATNAFVVTLVMAPDTPPVTTTATPVPTLQAWGLALLSLLIAGLGLPRMRRAKA